MRIGVDYQDGRVEFEAAEDRLIARWDGPADAPGDDLMGRVREALERPLDYPPLRQVVVPGDRVVVPLDVTLPGVEVFLAAIASILAEIGVESITVVVDGRDRGHPMPALPGGVTLAVHDPADRESLSYLATTEAGRRVYLSRLVTDADCVLPLGRFGTDPTLDSRGPWSIIEPGLGEAPPTVASLFAPASDQNTRLEESVEVSWLLGSQFQVGGIPGRSGVLHVLAGLAGSIRGRGADLLATTWQCPVPDRADLVIAGIGGPGRPCGPTELVEGLKQALGIVNRGGKIALLTRLGFDAVREVAKGPILPRGDWSKALAWADIYLASAAGPDEVDDLGLVPLDRADQAVKLAGSAHSYTTISQADRTRAVLADA